ncbi:MAG: type II toxin-antitoxin system PemK/MazF family toxin [Chitinophagaceae bacterium]
MELINQYDIILVNLDPTVGSEMKKTRPYVVLSPNEMNKHLQTLVIAPITSSSKPYPTRVAVMRTNTKGFIVIDQIRTINKLRVVKILDHLHIDEINKVKAVLQETFVD